MSKELARLPFVNKECMQAISSYEAQYGEIVVNGKRYVDELKEEEILSPRKVGAREWDVSVDDGVCSNQNAKENVIVCNLFLSLVFFNSLFLLNIGRLWCCVICNSSIFLTYEQEQGGKNIKSRENHK